MNTWILKNNLYEIPQIFFNAQTNIEICNSTHILPPNEIRFETIHSFDAVKKNSFQGMIEGES